MICPVIIGRDRDLELMDQLIAHSKTGQGQVALISGEAGIGKSRFVKEALARAPKQTTLLAGACFQNESALPYAPFLDLLRNFLATHTRKDTADFIGSTAPELVKILPELNNHLSGITAIQAADPKQEKLRIFQALIQIFAKSAQNQSVIILIEDLHWADSVSLEFLLSLARRVPSLSLLLLATYRSDELNPELAQLLAELDRSRLVTEFSLKHMSPPEVATMLQKTLELDIPINREFLDLIFPLTEGNPFFIEEILKALIAEGDVFFADGSWDRKAINQLHIPRTIQDAVQSRTQKLDEPTLRVLTLAAVMGRRFNFELLQELLGISELELTTALKQMLNAQLVVEDSVDRFAFRHALTREATYTTLLLRERKALHRQVAEATERFHAGSVQSQLADLSYHFFTGDVWHKALEYSKKAGDQACALYAQREAIIHYSRAVVSTRELNQIIDPALLSARGNAYELVGDFNSALDDFEQALNIARQSNNGQAEWQTLIDLGFLWTGRDYRKTGEYFRRAEELAQKLQNTKLHAQSLNRLGNWSVNIGETKQGLEIHRHALKIFEKIHDEQGMADTHDLLGMASMQQGDLLESFREYSQAIELYQKQDNKNALISSLTCASNTSNWNETTFVPDLDSDKNYHMAIEALELARQTGWMAGQAFIEWTIAQNRGNKGIFSEALIHGNESLRIATEIDHIQWIIAAQYVIGRTYLSMFQIDHAIQNLEQALKLALGLGSAWWIGNITADLTIACLLMGDKSTARSLLASAMEKTSDDLTMIRQRLLWVNGHLLLAENKPAEALEVNTQLLDSKKNTGNTQPIPYLLVLQGQALSALKQTNDAIKSLEMAKVGAVQRDALPLLWQIHALLGELHKRLKDNEKSRLEYSTARKILQTLEGNIHDEQMRQQFINRTLEMLPPEKPVSKRRREAEKFGGLTTREREVTRFISQGKSNREIAELLFLSERTVENHVANVLNKLGFDSRTQIAVWAMENGLGSKD